MTHTITPTTVHTDVSVRLRPDSPLHLDAVGARRWRVVDAKGIILGHLDAVAEERGLRFRARRYRAATRSFRDLGDFWSADDAADCLRFAG